jgi:hypothetical protein
VRRSFTKVSWCNSDVRWVDDALKPASRTVAHAPTLPSKAHTSSIERPQKPNRHVVADAGEEPDCHVTHRGWDVI